MGVLKEFIQVIEILFHYLKGIRLYSLNCLKTIW